MMVFVAEPQAGHHRLCTESCNVAAGPMLKCSNLSGKDNHPCKAVTHVSCAKIDEEISRHLKVFYCSDCVIGDEKLHEELENEIVRVRDQIAREKKDTVSSNTTSEQYKALRSKTDKMTKTLEASNKLLAEKDVEIESLRAQLQQQRKMYDDLKTRVQNLESTSVSLSHTSPADKSQDQSTEQLSPNSYLNYLDETMHMVDGHEKMRNEHSENSNKTFTYNSSSNNESRLGVVWPSYHDQSKAADDTAETTLALMRTTLVKPEPFNGNVMKWSTFLSEFLRTSKRGHYRECEDMDRLRELIQGEARAMFITELMDPCANALTTLKRLDNFYGVKGNAVRVALDCVTQLPKVEKQHHKDSLISLYTAIKNYAMQCRYHNKVHELSSEAIIVIIEAKMCYEHSHLWRTWARNNGKPENADTIIAFLEDQIQELNTRQSKPTKSSLRAHVHVTEATGGLSESYPAERSCELRPPPAVASASRDSNQESAEYRGGKKHNRYANRLCFYCKEKHPFFKCEKFIALPVSKRNEVVTNLHICRRCLSNDKHRARSCPNKSLKCFEPGCSIKFVHYLLHDHNANAGKSSSEASASCAHINHFNELSKSHFSMVPGYAIARDKTLIPTTIMFDTGSGISLASLDIFKRAQCVTTSEYDLTLHWANDDTHQTANVKLFDLEFLPQGHDKSILLQKLTALEELRLPAQEQDARIFQESFRYLHNIPIPSYEKQRPQILLGVPHAGLIAPLTIVKGKEPSDPVAALTRLGWTVYGCKPTTAICRPLINSSFLNSVCCETQESEVSNEELLQCIKYYNRVESIGISHTDASLMSADDQYAASLLNDGVKFMPEVNRYEAPLLWKKEAENMPDNYDEAVVRLKSTERRLQKLGMVQFANEHFNKQIQDGWLVETTREEAEKFPRRNYVYGFLTFNHNKQPPKPRWVNDTAAKFEGVSLNSQLMKGPDTMVPLPQAMCAMREGKTAYQADVKSMFNQIALREGDQYSQLTLWRDCNEKLPPRIYRQTRVIFGPTCSPAIASAVRVKHAKDCESEFPEAADVAQNQMYVDDTPDSRDTVEEAAKVANDLITMFARIGWPLIEFQSNSKQFLAMIPPENVSKRMALVNNDDEDYITKILGIFWKTNPDVYTFRLNDDKIVKQCLEHDHEPTKKEMLGTIMRMFDPTGMISPFRIRGQIIMQQTWKAGTDWKEKPPRHIIEQFIEWLKEFEVVAKLEIPRPYAQVSLKDSRLVLHIFVDASPDAYAACAYIHISHGDSIYVRLIASKARVAPIKYLSVPRLELMASLIGARLYEAVVSWHRRLKFEEYFCWTDSSTVYKWIRAPHLPRTAYTAPRISEIQELTSADRWRYVPSGQNVADYATKVRALDYSDAASEWQHGPDFLYGAPSEWPKQPDIIETTSHEATLIVRPLVSAVPLLAGVMTQISASARSQWNTHVKVVALALRFWERMLPGKPKCCRSGLLSPYEFERAENYIFRQVQMSVYPEEFELLSNGKMIPVTSKIASLSPVFCDRTKLIRASTRLSTNFPFNMRAPPILPNFNEVTEAIVSHYHRINLHVGDSAIVAALRSRVWIVNARKAVSRSRARCLKCIDEKKKVKLVNAADLPDFRFDISEKPFFHTGVDLFGPMKVYSGRSRFVKEIHVVIFTCMVTRAIFLEILDDQSTECFLGAFHKLWTRRGPIAHIYSDNGRNFVGAASWLEKDEFQQFLCEKKMKWHFIPAFTPQFGGTWERLIKDVKRGLSSSIGKFIVPRPNVELALTMIESNVNNRPLTELPVSSLDEAPITPYLLMTGHPNYPVCDESSGLPLKADVDLMKMRTMGRVNSLVQQFRSRFVREYAPVIARRSDDPKKKRNVIKLHDYVTYLDPTKNPSQWPRGIVCKIYPGRDDKSRVADIKLKNGEVIPRRSIYRLAKIDIRFESKEAEQFKYSAVVNVMRGEGQSVKRVNAARIQNANIGSPEAKRSKHIHVRAIDDSTNARCEISAERSVQLSPREDNVYLRRSGDQSVFVRNLPGGLGASQIFTMMQEFGEVKTIMVPHWSEEGGFNAIINFSSKSAVETALRYDESQLVTVNGKVFKQRFERMSKTIKVSKLFRESFFRFVRMSDEFGVHSRILLVTEGKGKGKQFPVRGKLTGFINICPLSHKYEFERAVVDESRGTGAIRALPFVLKTQAQVNVVPVDPTNNSTNEESLGVQACPTASMTRRRVDETEGTIKVTFRAEDPCVPAILVRVGDDQDLREIIKDRQRVKEIQRLIKKPRLIRPCSPRLRGDDVVTRRQKE